MAINVGVFGAAGRMGRTVCRAVCEDPDLDLVAAVAPHHQGLDLKSVTGVDCDLHIDLDGRHYLRTDGLCCISPWQVEKVVGEGYAGAVFRIPNSLVLDFFMLV